MYSRRRFFRTCYGRGKVIHARGTANKDAEQLFHIAIQPDKDIVMILVPADIKDKVLHAIYRNAGLNSQGKGIAFSLPVDEVIGLSKAPISPAEPAKAEEKQEEPKENKDSKEDSENKESKE